MWMVCCWQLIASNIPALNTRAQMERIASNIAGNIARCGCPLTGSTTLVLNGFKTDDYKMFYKFILLAGQILMSCWIKSFLSIIRKNSICSLDTASDILAP